jgi:hypothetical protein
MSIDLIAARAESLANYARAVRAANPPLPAVSVPFATVPVPHYVRQAPIPPFTVQVGQVASAVRTNNVMVDLGPGQSGNALLIIEAAYARLFEEDAPKVPADRVTRTRDVGGKAQRYGARAIRVLTPRFVVDVAEMDGARLAAFVGPALDLAAELNAKLADLGPGQMAVVGHPTLFVKKEAYMFESFGYVEYFVLDTKPDQSEPARG